MRKTIQVKFVTKNNDIITFEYFITEKNEKAVLASVRNFDGTQTFETSLEDVPAEISNDAENLIDIGYLSGRTADQFFFATSCSTWLPTDITEKYSNISTQVFIHEDSVSIEYQLEI